MKFSIIVPVYNVEKYIRQCLDSIKKQTFTDFEALIVDDCGTDSSIDIVKEYAANDERFVIIKQDYNQGVSAARNAALDRAQGEYIVFADADDWLELNALEVIYNAFEKSKADVVWYGAYKATASKRTTPEENELDHMEYVTNLTLTRMVGCIWNKSFRTSAINKIGLRFPVGMIIEDSEFTFRAFTRLKKAYYIKDILYNYRTDREGSLTTDDKINSRICDEFKIINRMYDYLKENNLFNEYKPFLVWILGHTIKKILFIQHQRRFIISEANDLMNRMNFPDDFKDMERSAFLQMN